MSSAPRYLLDTNILLRLSKRDDPHYTLVQSGVNALAKAGSEICFTTQNMAEFWNVCTRPADRNGFGLSIQETDARAQAIERTMTRLSDNDRIYHVWRQLIVQNRVSGVQVHDARLAAAMQVQGISHILTLNQPDFIRYSTITVVHPSKIPV